VTSLGARCCTREVASTGKSTGCERHNRCGSQSEPITLLTYILLMPHNTLPPLRLRQKFWLASRRLLRSLATRHGGIFCATTSDSQRSVREKRRFRAENRLIDQSEQTADRPKTRVKIEKKIRLRARRDGKVIILLKKVNFLEEQHGNSGLMMKGFMRVGIGTLRVRG
jgi:hypothetical protein